MSLGSTDPRQVALDRIERARQRPARLTDDRVTMAHGAGGKASRTLVEALILDAFRNPALAPLSDAARIGPFAGPIAVTTDAFVVHPLEFPGGTIGELAVNGTVNDLAMVGARPRAITVALVLEEGLEIARLRRIIEGLANAASAASVDVVAGDTKVVERGAADGCYIVTTGVGVIDVPQTLGVEEVRAGDAVLVSGPIGDHGVTVMLARGELDIRAPVVSDTAPLTDVALALCAAVPGVRFLRDPTRGGVATVLNEVALDGGVGIEIDETAVPVRPEVRGACELLGIDPLYVACEGRFVAIVAPGDADLALAAIRDHPFGAGAALIGAVTAEPEGTVLVRTPLGGLRVADLLVGDPLPRIC